MGIMLEGFEQFDKTEDLVAQMRKAGYSIDGGNVVMGNGVNGRCVVTQKTSIGLGVPWTDDKMSFGISAKFSGRGGLFSINGNAFIADAVTGFFRYCGISGSAIPIKDRWYFYEVELDRANDTIELFINGKSQGIAKAGTSISGEQKLILKLNAYTESKTLEQVNTSNSVEDSAARSFDNMYIAGGDRFGPLTITTRFPDSSISSEWDIHTSVDMTHAQLLGKIPSEELDRYLMTNKDGKVESMTSSTPLPDEAGKVVGIGVVALVRKTDREDASIIVGIGDRRQDISDIPFVWGYRYAGWRATDSDTKETVQNSELSLTSSIRSL